MKSNPRSPRANLACAHLAGHREAGPSIGQLTGVWTAPIVLQYERAAPPLAALGWGGALVTVQGGVSVL